MNKRNLIKLVGIFFLTIAFSAFKLPSLGGGGGGADWKSIAGDFDGAFKKINSGMVLVLQGIVDSNNAIGIKEIAATQLLEQAKKIEGGAKMPTDFAEKSTTYFSEGTKKMIEKVESGTLTAQEKMALAKASKNYFLGSVKAVPGYIQFFTTFQKAQKAGTPKPMDLVGAAKDIPSILSNAPAMFEMIPTTFNAVKAYRDSLKAANIEAQGSEGVNEAVKNATEGLMG